jgi:hypothetical protein
MSHHDETTDARRKFLKLMGGSAVLLPLATLSACSGGEQSAPASSGSAAPAPAPEPKPEPEKAMPEEQPAQPAADTGGEMPRLSESDPQAQSLGYVHDATTVDTSKYPRYQAGQACSNCALYMGGDAEWGGCSIFPGRQVKGTGWCSVYAPKAG